MLELDYKTILGIITIALGIYGSYDYIKDTIKGVTKPHLYTWILFTIMDTIAFLIQLQDGAGPGAWGTLATGIMGLIIVILAFVKGEKNITKSDHLSFVFAILSVFLYLTIDNPIYSLVMVLFVLGFAMYPTFRKSYSKPTEETLSVYTIAGIRSIISIIATINISVLTIGLPLFIILINTVFVAMVIIRRKQLK